MQDWTPREHYTAEDLVEIIRILRDRDTGCPWDKVQTHASIRKNFLEETCEKLVFRHPNIFASSAAENAGINGWDALKNKEKGRTTLADELDTVPLTLPALMRAQKLQKRAARFGCGPEDAAGAARALDSAKAGWDEAQTQESAGELLLAAADAMRLAGVDAEEALTFAAKRFTQRLEADETETGTRRIHRLLE